LQLHEVVADDRRSCSDRDHDRDRVVPLRREDAKRNQGGLAWNGDPERLDRHRSEQQWEARDL
jgi:hypothetical protein